MRKVLIVSLVVLMIVTQPVFAGGNVENALVINRSIYNKLGYDISNDFTMPVLSYNEYTYISVKDIANYLDFRVEWLPSINSIRLMQPEKDEFYVKSDTMAIDITKAAVNEYFSQYVTDATTYFAYLNGPVSVGKGYRYFVWISFDFKATNGEDTADQIIKQSQVCVQLEPSNGAIELIELYEMIETPNELGIPTKFCG